MLQIESSIEAEDLLYAVLTREQIVTKMLHEAEDKMNGRLAGELAHERNRLNILKEKLEEHVEDTDYRMDWLCRMFPDMCTD